MTASCRPIDTALFDRSVSPAEDFYRHVNGGWLDAHPVPPEYGSWGAFHEVTEANKELLHGLLLSAAEKPDAPGTPRRKAGDYFAAAMDEAAIAEHGTTPLAELLDRVAATRSLGDLPQTARVLQRAGVGALYSLGISPDFENSDAYLVYLGQGGLGLPERDYYLRDDDQSVQLRAEYVSHVATQLGNLGRDASASQAAAEAILAFETRLAEASLPAEKMRDVQLTLNRRTVASLDELMPDFGLTAHVRSLGVDAPTVNVDNAGFFTTLQVALGDTDLDTIRDYLTFHVLRTYAQSLPSAFEQAGFDFYGRILGGRQKMLPRWKRVLDVATGDIGEIVAQLFVEEAFSEEAKTRCEHMVDHILSAMGSAIGRAGWMSEATKAQALEKLAGFGYKIGFPDEWRDYGALAVERDSYAANRLRCARFEYDREMGRLAKPVDKAEWAMPAHMVNAYYHPLLNEIVFPAGILQPPFFYAEADDAVNFGAIGAVIAHEITHGFDDQGSRFDARGSLREWWTEADRAEFDRRADLLVQQYDGYEVAEDLHVNGRLTLGENIADLGGVTIALEALLETLPADAPPVDGLTPAQRFFIAYAAVWRTNTTPEYERLLVNIDPHSPARFRVNGPLSNLPAFAEAFAIPAGSAMVGGLAAATRIW